MLNYQRVDLDHHDMENIGKPDIRDFMRFNGM
jgi:hypothetical protein